MGKLVSSRRNNRREVRSALLGSAVLAASCGIGSGQPPACLRPASTAKFSAVSRLRTRKEEGTGLFYLINQNIVLLLHPLIDCYEMRNLS